MNEVEQVKQKVDIVDLLGEYIELKRAGRNFKALCPFHSEKSPSFMVSPERQTWHCFGCGKGGDIFTFLEEYEKMDFYESLKLLADRVGVKLTKTVYKTEQEEKRAKILALNSLAAQLYSFLLLEHPVGEKARTYLTEKRQIPLPLIKKFQLGYAPDSYTTLISYLSKKKKYPVQELIDAGLATMGKTEAFDFFRERIMFPIMDSRGNIIAFSGRALTDEQMPKYINTRDTLVYKKSDSVFGIYFAKEAIRKEERVILVEGEFDVISAFKEGIQNIVAIKGTALTEGQIQLLKRYAQKIMFCFDTDPAGTAAQKRSIALIEKEGILTSVIVPPEGKDPDELLRENPALFKTAIKKSINIYDFIIDSALQAFDPTTSEGKRRVLENTISFLAPIENEVIKEHYLKKLAASIQSSFESVNAEAQKFNRPIVKTKPNEPKKKVAREELVEKYLLSLVLQIQSPQHLAPLLETTNAEMFSIPAVERIIMALKNSLQNNPSLTIEAFAKTLPTELLETFDTCLLTPLPPFETEAHYEEEIKRTITEAKNLTIKKRLKEIEEEMRQKEQDEEAIGKLQQEFEKLTKLL